MTYLEAMTPGEQRDEVRARIAAGQPEITIRQLAADAGVPPSVVSGLTSGRAKQVAFITLDRLCKALEFVPEDE